MEPILLENSPQLLRFFLYNTMCQIQYLKEQVNWKCINHHIFKEACRVQSLLSIYDADSELWKLNHQAKTGIPFPVSHQLFTQLHTVLKAASLSGGTFDPTLKPVMDLWNFKQIPPSIPSEKQIRETLSKTGTSYIRSDHVNETITFMRNGMQLDSGGWGKGLALQCCRNLLLKHGVTDAILNFGSSLCMMGINPGQPDGKWRVGIQRPWNPRGITMGGLKLAPCSISTSAAYDNFYYSDGRVYHHLIDPQTGYPSLTDLVSASVACSSPLYSDILSTVFFIGGEEKGCSMIRGLQLEQETGWILVYTDGSVVISPNLSNSYLPELIADSNAANNNFHF